MTVTVVKDLAQFKEIINSDTYSIFDFWATWCGPCRVISPIFEKLAAGAGEQNIRFYKVDVDEATDISEEVGIRAMPTFMLFKSGQKVNELVGANPQGLENLIATAV